MPGLTRDESDFKEPSPFVCKSEAGTADLKKELIDKWRTKESETVVAAKEGDNGVKNRGYCLNSCAFLMREFLADLEKL